MVTKIPNIFKKNFSRVKEIKWSFFGNKFHILWQIFFLLNYLGIIYALITV